MKANDLMLGNITEQGVVTELRENVCRVEYFTTHKRTSLVSYEDLNPIPLTEEILLKCGFYYKGSNFYFYDLNDWSNIQVSFYNGKYALSMSVQKHAICPPVIYLHQLQNLYYNLTGQHLEIEL